MMCFLAEDYIENKGFPKKMQFFHEISPSQIKTETGDIFNEPGLMIYTVELRGSNGSVLYKVT